MNLRIAPLIRLYEVGSPVPQTKERELALPVVASRAFGDGSHPTTRICAGAVDLLCRQQRFRSVLDVGTGTGVLARIARARGASNVMGTEIDAEALAAARANSALDSFPGELAVSDQAPDHWGPRFELVIANILEQVLKDLAPSLFAALAPGGTLLISGFTPLQSPALRIHFTRLGLTFINEAQLEGWSLLMFRRQSGGEHGT